jgi:hypothetical protein
VKSLISTLAGLLIGFIVLHAPALAIQVDTSLPNWRPGPHGDLAFESSQFLRTTGYRKPEGILAEMDDDGAYGLLNRAWDQTHRGSWRIEEQRYGFDAIVAGITYHRQSLIDAGEKMLDWGFQHQKPDGSFACSDQFHSMSFFIEAASHAAILLEASDLRSGNQDWVADIKPRLRQAALWMIKPSNATLGQANDAPYTHRFYLDADALGETGILLQDYMLVKASQAYIHAGLQRQTSAGYNPEKNGWDTSYHAVGLLFALDYYTLVADAKLRYDMQPMILHGLIWLRGRIRKDGTVDQTGNTRTGFGQERSPQGKLKTMSYGSAYRAFFQWAMITRDVAWAQVAKSLFDGQHVEAERRSEGVNNN